MIRRSLAAACLVALAATRVGAVCAPAATAIFPAAGTMGTQVTATVDGEALTGATVTVVGDAGVAATVQSANDLGATLQITIDATALAGERVLVLETAGGTAAVSFTVNAAGGPIPAGVTPRLVGTVGLPLDVTVSGSGFTGVSAATVSVSGAGVAVSTAAPSPDGTSLAIGILIDPSAELGTHAITIANGTGSAVLMLYVRRPPPTVTQVAPAAGAVGASVPITITGSNLSGAALVVTTVPGGDQDIAITDVAIPDDTTMTATLVIAPTAVVGDEPRLLIVTTESGQTTIEFFVVAAGVPTVTGILPGAGEPGETVPVTIKGLRLTGAMVTEISAAFSLENQIVVDDETITLDVVVSGGAPVDTNHVLTVTTGEGSDTGTFRVIGVGEPFVAAVRPPFGNRGAQVLLRVLGRNLADIVSILLSSSGITESNAMGLDERTAIVTLDISNNANAGASRDVIVTTATGSFTKSAAFRVNVPGQVPTITDVTPTVLEPGTTTSLTVTGSNFDGGGVVVTGPGIGIANVVVSPDGTQITFDATLAADAPAETRAVIVVTENGIARCNVASNPAPPPLVAAKLVKTGAAFDVASTAFRLFVFEFSANDLFTPGLRTIGINDTDGALVLDRQDTVAIARAFRDLDRGFVRVRAVTATNRVAASVPQPIRR